MSQRDQLSDYLLGELEGAERVRFEAELSADPELAAEVERLRPVVQRLDTLDPAAWTPPADLPPLPPVASPPVARRPRRRRQLVLRPLPAFALAAVLLALGIAAGALLSADDDAAGGRVVALAPVEPLGGTASGSVRFAASGEQATLHLAGLAPS